MKRRVAFGLCILGSCALLHVAWLTLLVRFGQERFRNVTLWVDGWALSEGASEQALLDGLGERVAARQAYLRDGAEMYALTFAELGIELDRAATRARLRASRPDNSWQARLARAVRGENAEPQVASSFVFDRERALQHLASYSEALARKPVDARLDLNGHRRIDDMPGRALDVPSSVAELERQNFAETPVFDAQFRELPARIRSESLPPVDVTRVLAAFETDFSKKPMSRRPNIEAAARYLEGFVLAPKAVLSFNKVVGPRTFERGFREAPVIVADELESDLGGGVCQVATALFAASTLGGLEILERRSHSRPSGYAPLGLDAAVIYGKVDLRIRNPYSVPIMLHSTFPDPKRLRIELLGLEPPAKIDHSYAVRERKPFHRRVLVKSDLPADAIDQRQKGNPGYEVVSTLRSVGPDGAVRTREYASRYYPVPEVFWIGTAVDPNSSLPELPEDATHVIVEPALPAQ